LLAGPTAGVARAVRGGRAGGAVRRLPDAASVRAARGLAGRLRPADDQGVTHAGASVEHLGIELGPPSGGDVAVQRVQSRLEFLRRVVAEAAKEAGAALASRIEHALRAAGQGGQRRVVEIVEL